MCESLIVKRFSFTSVANKVIKMVFWGAKTAPSSIGNRNGIIISEQISHDAVKSEIRKIVVSLNINQDADKTNHYKFRLHLFHFCEVSNNCTNKGSLA